MIVPTKIVKKDGYEIVLMLFPIYQKDNTVYEFHLVKTTSFKVETLKIKEYRPPLKIEKIAEELTVKPEDIKELLDKLYV